MRFFVVVVVVTLLMLVFVGVLMMHFMRVFHAVCDHLMLPFAPQQFSEIYFFFTKVKTWFKKTCFWRYISIKTDPGSLSGIRVCAVGCSFCTLHLKTFTTNGTTCNIYVRNMFELFCCSFVKTKNFNFWEFVNVRFGGRRARTRPGTTNIVPRTASWLKISIIKIVIYLGLHILTFYSVLQFLEKIQCTFCEIYFCGAVQI